MNHSHPGSSAITAINKKVLILVFTLISASYPGLYLQAQSKNGFDLSNTSINANEIFSGGPRRDGIPSINHPRFIKIKKVDYLNDDDIVIGLTRGNIARAYPTRILVWHEIVNDIIGNDPVVITYCPLCGTGMVFSRKIGNEVISFGVSGLLYRSDVLMYDRRTHSLWSQLLMKAVSGNAIGKKLTWLPSEYSTWKAWKKNYPNGEVLSLNTGYNRNYRAGGMYTAYHSTQKLMFPVPHKRLELPNKELVIGVIINGQAKAYPIKYFSKNQAIKDKLGNRSLIVRYSKANKSHKIINAKGKHIPSVLVYWFAWQAFYPDTKLWKP